MKTIVTLILAACAVTSSVSIQAQDPYPPTARQIQKDLSQGSDQDINQALAVDIGLGAPKAPNTIIPILLQRKLASQARLIAEAASESIQNGGSTLSSASTSLVSKSMSSLLGIAEEAGAISSSTSGSTTTLTANLQQIANYLGPGSSRCYLISTHCPLGSLLVRGGTASLSLNSSAQTGAPGLSSASSAALAALSGVQNPVFSGFSFQESLHGRKRTSIESKDFEDAVGKIDKGKIEALLAAYGALVRPLADTANGNHALAQKALDDCVKQLKQSNGQDKAIEEAEHNCVEAFADVAQTVPGIDDLIKNFLQAENAYIVARDQALKDVFYDSTYAFNYDLTNNASQPMTSTFKVIYGYQHQFSHSVLQTTANGSATIYNSLRGSTESRIRSAQGALQFDYKRDSTFKVQSELSAGYYFQYMAANGLIDLPSTAFAPGTTIALPSNASVLLNTTGPIHIGQGKLTLSIKGTNIKIPLAITGASRTDLIKANKVSGNFGISYDFSSLLSPK